MTNLVTYPMQRTSKARNYLLNHIKDLVINLSIVYTYKKIFKDYKNSNNIYSYQINYL